MANSDKANAALTVLFKLFSELLDLYSSGGQYPQILSAAPQWLINVF